MRGWIEDSFPHAAQELLAVLSIDGKTLRSSAHALEKGVHLLALVAHHSRVVVAQGRVDEKTNEPKGALALLTETVLTETVVVGDAAFCSAICANRFSPPREITCSPSKRINPLYSEKSRRNSPPPTRPFPPWSRSERGRERQTATTYDKGHGRIEVRTLTSTVSLSDHVRWPGVQQVLQLVSERRRPGAVERETRYFIISLSRARPMRPGCWR